MNLTIATILLLPLSALAADCSHKNIGKPDSTTLSQFWKARETMCNCIGSQPGNFCSVITRFYSFAAWGVHPTERLCWDATKDIIKQCIANGEFLFRGERMRIYGLIMDTIGWDGGLYQLNGSTFNILRKN